MSLSALDEKFNEKNDDESIPVVADANVSAFKNSAYAMPVLNGNSQGIEGGFHPTAGCSSPQA